MTCPLCLRWEATWEVRVDDDRCPDSVRGEWIVRCSSCKGAVKKFWRHVSERPLVVAA